MNLITGNNLDVLKQYPDNYFDAVVTDPPYGLGKEPDATELMKDWIEKGYHEVKGTGFMGKEWDAFVPQPIFWKEVFRVLKPGGHVLAFYGTRTFDWGVMAMRFAGFEVRDTVYWHYGSGFPKSHNIGKNIEKINVGGIKNLKQVGTKKGIKLQTGTQGYSYNKEYVAGKSMGGKQISGDIPIYEINNEWNGWGSALKPASEPIVLARKPLEKGLSIAENVLKWGVGGINIDGCRVSFKDAEDYKESTQKNQHEDFGTKPMTNNNVYGDYSMVKPKNYQPQGRFPANLILTHHPDCELKGLKKVGSGKQDGYNYKGREYDVEGFIPNNSPEANSNYGEETVEHWECVDGCPIKMMDEQSGKLNKQGVSKSDNKSGWQNKYVGGDKVNAIERKLYLDEGGASRFFYVAKASKSERNRGLDEKISERKTPMSGRGQGGLKCKNCGRWKNSGNPCSCEHPDFEEVKFNSTPNFNGHPTVKPIKLMQYLVRMVTPPNGLVLDPFCGSGTTGIACKLEGFNFVGIEQDQEYTKIAQARIENYTDEPEEKMTLIENADEENLPNQLSLFD